MKRTRLAAAAFTAFLVAGAPALAQEPLARIEGLPDLTVFDLARAAVGEVETQPDTEFAARRNAARAAEQVIAALRAEGFYGAEVRPRVETGEPPTAIVEVQPGPRFLFGEIAIGFIGPLSDADMIAIRRAAELETGAPARSVEIVRAERAVVAALHEAGYADARAGERNLVVDHERTAMDVHLTFETGPLVRMGEIRATGGAHVRPELLRRLVPFDQGDVYAPDQLNAYSRRFRDTNAFSSVAITLGEPENPDADDQMRPILVALEDEPRRTLSLGGSYSTSEGVGVEAAWILRNAFGGAEQLTLEGNLQTIERSIGAELAIPAWRRARRILRLSTEAIQEETDAYDRNAFSVDAEAEQPLSERLSAALGVGLTLQETTDADGAQSLALIRGAGTLRWDSTNNPLDPSRGERLRLTLQPISGFGDATIAYLITDAEGSIYYPLRENRLTAAARLRLGAITATDIDDAPAGDLFFAGGGGSIRGYSYQAVSPRDATDALIGGASLVETSFELRARVTESFGGVVFLDGGAASADTTPSFSDVRWGAGVGLRYYAGFGPLRADIATPLDPIDGDPRVQLYFSIGQSF